MKGSKYTPEIKAATLVAVEVAGGNVSEASRVTGIPERTIAGWMKLESAKIPQSSIGELRAVMKKDLSNVFEQIVEVYTERALDPEAVSKTSGYYAIQGGRAAAETMRLLREQPTSIQAAGDDEFGQMVKEYAKRFSLPLSVARENIKRNLTNPTAIAALDAIELASEEKQ